MPSAIEIRANVLLQFMYVIYSNCTFITRNKKINIQQTHGDDCVTAINARPRKTHTKKRFNSFFNNANKNKSRIRATIVFFFSD